jgi:hypothetical protein
MRDSFKDLAFKRDELADRYPTRSPIITKCMHQSSDSPNTWHDYQDAMGSPTRCDSKRRGAGAP